VHATAALNPAKPGYVIVPGASGPVEGDPDDVATIPGAFWPGSARRPPSVGAPDHRQPRYHGRHRLRRPPRWRWPGCSRALTRSATGNGETVELRDITVAAQRVTWKQSVTKPMPLNLEFDVEVHGDRLTGHSRAGRPPRAAVSGVRRY
jgi:hypothetical protein